jgi:tricarballylate dehydrogenase
VNEPRVDVVVLGAGLAGLSAAVTAAQAGATVVVVEKAETVGGSALMSGGYVWALADHAALRREDPGSMQRHGQLVVDGYNDAINWLSGFTPKIAEEAPSLAGRGPKFDMSLAFAQLLRQLTAAGGRILTRATVTDVEARGDGTFRCAVEAGSDRSVLTTRSLVLATGGRQADSAVRADLAHGRLVPPLRSNPHSDGGGARVAGALGGVVNSSNRGFYGHLFAQGVELLTPVDFITFALYQSDFGVMLDYSGRRFADESRGDHNNAMALADHSGHGLLLWSDAVQQAAAGAPFVPASPQMDRWAFSRDRGGRVERAGSADALLPTLREWSHNAALELDEGSRLRLGSGPVYAADVVPAVTFTFGGVVADDDGVALSASGDQISGVFPAGADLSDVYHQGYGGGLCLAVVSGRRAGRLAADRIGAGSQ